MSLTASDELTAHRRCLKQADVIGHQIAGTRTDGGTHYQGIFKVANHILILRRKPEVGLITAHCRCHRAHTVHTGPCQTVDVARLVLSEAPVFPETLFGTPLTQVEDVLYGMDGIE